MIQYESSLIHSGMMTYESELMHHGIKGMRWGHRKFQNPDGSLTELGKKKSIKNAYRVNKSLARRMNRAERKIVSERDRSRYFKDYQNSLNKRIKKQQKKGNTEKASKLIAKANKLKANKIDPSNKYISDAKKYISNTANVIRKNGGNLRTKNVVRSRTTMMGPYYNEIRLYDSKKHKVRRH